MMIVVRPAITSRNAARISCSFVGSTDDVASSRISTRGSASTAARDRDALALPARQRVAVFTDHRLVAVGQRLDEVGGARERGGAANLIEVGFGVGERDVLAHAVAEQERVFEHDADRAANVAELEVAHVDAVEQHPSVVDVVEARDQPGDRGLAARGRADERDRLARTQHEVEALEHHRTVAVAEVDALEAELALPVDRERRTARADR